MIIRFTYSKLKRASAARCLSHRMSAALRTQKKLQLGKQIERCLHRRLEITRMSIQQLLRLRLAQRRHHPPEYCGIRHFARRHATRAHGRSFGSRAARICWDSEIGLVGPVRDALKRW